MIEYKNYNDGTPYSCFGGPTDNGMKLDIGGQSSLGKSFPAEEEVIRIHKVFFDKSYPKQRKVLIILIKWALNHYIKIIFK